MSIWSDLGLPEPHPADPDEVELIVEQGVLAGYRFGTLEKRDPELGRKLLTARDRRRLRRGCGLHEQREAAFRLRLAVSIGADIAEMSNHERLEFFAKCGKALMPHQG